ncbi:MAG: flagellar hook-basal body complex protein FliE [Bryobacteraceae bacterium]
MSIPVSPVRLDAVLPLTPMAGAQKPAGSAFSSMFHEAVQQVEQYQKSAALQVQQFLGGETDDVHSTAMAVQRAELTFDLFQQVRSKVVQAYQEVMRQQL